MRALVLLSCLAVVGCKHDLPAPTLDIAEPSNMAAAEKITCRVGPKQTTLALDDGGLHLRFVTAKGNAVSMMGREAGDGDATLKDALARFGDARAGAEWLDVDAKVTSPDGQTTSVKVSLRIDHAMTKRLDGARSTPVQLPGEEGTSKVVYVHPAGEAPPYVIGEGRWRDVGLVVFETATRTLGKLCRTQQGDWSDIAVLSGHMKSHVELYDRRSGKRIDETTIDGPESCPDEHDASSPSNDAAIRAWVASKSFMR